RRRRPPPRVHRPQRQGAGGDRALLRRSRPERRAAGLTAGAHAVPPLWAPARGRLAQLVEHLVYTERVGGSSPSPPTMGRPPGAGRPASRVGARGCGTRIPPAAGPLVLRNFP